jgi:membrane protein required for colicin V production
MTLLDIFIVIVLIIAAISGYMKGLIHQVTSLAALILGLFVAVKFTKIFSPSVVNYLHLAENTAKVTTFLVLFIIVLIGVHFAGKMLEKAFDDHELGHLNKFAGSIFSSIKWAFILSAIFVILNLFNKSDKIISADDAESSILYKPISALAPAIFPYLRFEDEQVK